MRNAYAWKNKFQPEKSFIRSFVGTVIAWIIG